MEWLAWLENTSLATWVRESESLWAYPTILTLHTFGLSLLVGANVALALRLLGFAPGVPLAPLAFLFRIMWAGFVINALSGAGLFIAEATSKATQPIFFVKLALVALGMANIYLFPVDLLREPEKGSLRGKIFAVSSIVIWAGAITAGRLMAYLKTD